MSTTITKSDISSSETVSRNVVEYRAWDVPVRLCHWTIVLSFIFLSITGLFLLNEKYMAVGGLNKVMIKTVHTYAGYVTGVALIFRIIWGFVGSKSSRWSNILPINGAFWRDLSVHLNSMKSGTQRHYIGYNPLGRLMVTAFFALLITQVVTGIIVGGADVFAWPLGDYFRNWIVASGVNPASLLPANPTGVDPEKFKAMREFRAPIRLIHEYSFYVLVAMIPLHITGVMVAEIRERVALVSSMFSGRKALPSKPVDL